MSDFDITNLRFHPNYINVYRNGVLVTKIENSSIRTLEIIEKRPKYWRFHLFLGALFIIATPITLVFGINLIATNLSLRGAMLGGGIASTVVMLSYLGLNAFKSYQINTYLVINGAVNVEVKSIEKPKIDMILAHLNTLKLREP